MSNQAVVVVGGRSAGMESIGSRTGRVLKHSMGSSMRSVLALVGLLLLAPLTALATPITYTFSSGSAVVRGTLAGSSTSIFQGASSLNVPLVGVSAVYDADAGLFGRLESFTLQARDFNIDLDEVLVGLDTLTVNDPTLTSLAGSDLNLFGQFTLPTSISGTVSGAFPGGSTFGPIPIESLSGTGSSSGLVSVSGDKLILSVVGVTVASFPQLASRDPNAPNVEIKADFVFVGNKVEPAVPEPSAALLYAAGLVTLGMAKRRTARNSA